MNKLSAMAGLTPIEKGLSIFWCALLLPGLIIGALWSGSIPLWPPVVSDHTIDIVIWAALFLLSYGVPLYLCIRIWLTRRKIHQ